jgi:SAM-dependent methyltransferase
MSTYKRVLDLFIPRAARREAVRATRRLLAQPPIGAVDFGDLRRTRPICGDWGYSRGTPIDRYYIARFMERHAADVHGRVLEVGTDELTLRYGGGRVTNSDVLHAVDPRPPVTIIGDLTKPEMLPEGAFDCAIITQTLHFIYDIHAVAGTLHHLLKPGGVALLTFPGISKISPEDMERWGQYWCLTSASARRLFSDAFPRGSVAVEAAGNVLAATAFLYGIAAEELTEAELDVLDPHMETLVGVRAQKVA